MITAQTDLITENKLRGSEADHPEFFMGAQETETGGCFYRYDSRNQIRCREDIFEGTTLFDRLKKYMSAE